MNDQGVPWPAPEAAPGGGRPRRLGWLLVIIGVLAAACLGGAAFAAVKVGQNLAPDDAAPRPFGLGGSARATPAVDASAAAGPQASSYPVRTNDDLERVCDNWFYPQSPKVQAKALNPVAAFIDDSKDLRILVKQPLYDIPERSSAAAKAAWNPAGPAKVRLVACVELVSSGAKLKACKFDDPKPAKITMARGNYNLSVYEVATGRKITEKPLRGEDQACPFGAVLGADRLIYSGVTDRQLFEILRKWVEK